MSRVPPGWSAGLTVVLTGQPRVRGRAEHPRCSEASGLESVGEAVARSLFLSLAGKVMSASGADGDVLVADENIGSPIRRTLTTWASGPVMTDLLKASLDHPVRPRSGPSVW
jgi:hypothetical protein